MPVLVATLIAAATLTFGAVYPWAYLPLFGAAAVIGLAGLPRTSLRRMRALIASLALLCVTAALQIVPIPRSMLDALSPATIGIVSSYNLTFSGAAASVPLSIDPERTKVAVLGLIALTLYVLGLSGLLSSRSVRTLPAALAVFAVPFALFGMYTRQYNNGLIYGFWRPLDGGGADQFGSFVNRNHFGGWMLMAVCLLTGYLFGQMEHGAPGRGERRLAWLSSASANRIIVTAAAVTICVVSLFWTMSRSAITGFAIAGVAFVALARARRRLDVRQRAGIVATLAALLLMGVAWRGPAQLVAWFQDDRNLLSRIDAWRDGWTVVDNFPFFGSGLNTYATAMLFYQQRNPGFHMAQAHNDYLQLLAEGGLMVAVPAVLTLVLLARAIHGNLGAARAEARGYWIRAGAAVGLLGIAVQEIFEFTLQIPAAAFLFCTLAAIALSSASTEPRARSRRHALKDAPDAKAVARCPRCHSVEIQRSRTRGPWEKRRRKMTGKRPYRCRQCKWRGWLATSGRNAAHAQSSADVPETPNPQGTPPTKDQT